MNERHPQSPAAGRRHRLVAGLVVVVGGLAVADFVRIDSTSHSASDTLISWVPQVALLVMLALGLVRLLSRRSD